MRNTLIFAGSSIPELTKQICTNLGMAPAGVELSQFANVSSQQACSGAELIMIHTGRDQRQNPHQHQRKGCLCGAVR
jgi:phosphoribosylpyrophosphate synthetase